MCDSLMAYTFVPGCLVCDGSVPMQAALQLKEEDAERLVKAAIARSERPWLVLLSVASVLSAVLLGVLLLALRSQGGA